MTISDIITILSLVIAIIAIISEKQRKHLLLKYGWVDIVFYSLIFILINYFVFYKEFYGKGVYLDVKIPDLFPKNRTFKIRIFGHN